MLKIFEDLGYKKQICKTCGNELTLVEMLHVMNMDLLEILLQTSHMIYMKFKKHLEIS